MAQHTISTEDFRRIRAAVIKVEQLAQDLRILEANVDDVLPFLFRRFEMTAYLARGSGTTRESATVTRIDYDADTSLYTDEAEAEFTAVDFQQRFSKMVTVSPDGGALGWAIKPHDQPDWEILTMETPAPFWGTLGAQLTREVASVTVNAVDVLGGYNVFGEAHGAGITAYNPVGAGGGGTYWYLGDAGDRVYCEWDMTDSKYWIKMVEPA